MNWERSVCVLTLHDDIVSGRNFQRLMCQIGTTEAYARIWDTDHLRLAGPSFVMIADPRLQINASIQRRNCATFRVTIHVNDCQLVNGVLSLSLLNDLALIEHARNVRNLHLLDRMPRHWLGCSLDGEYAKRAMSVFRYPARVTSIGGTSFDPIPFPSRTNGGIAAFWGKKNFWPGDDKLWLTAEAVRQVLQHIFRYYELDNAFLWLLVCSRSIFAALPKDLIRHIYSIIKQDWRNDALWLLRVSK